LFVRKIPDQSKEPFNFEELKLSQLSERKFVANSMQKIFILLMTLFLQNLIQKPKENYANTNVE
jgi:hypothetical protein